MGFRDSLITILEYCIAQSLVRFGDTPLVRLSDEDIEPPYFENVTDAYSENIVYSYEKFIEIINSKGLDGFVF